MDSYYELIGRINYWTSQQYLSVLGDDYIKPLEDTITAYLRKRDEEERPVSPYPGVKILGVTLTEEDENLRLFWKTAFILTPRYTRPDGPCTVLGTSEEFNLYACKPGGEKVRLIAQYGDGKEDCHSCSLDRLGTEPWSDSNCEAMFEDLFHRGMLLCSHLFAEEDIGTVTKNLIQARIRRRA